MWINLLSNPPLPALDVALAHKPQVLCFWTNAPAETYKAYSGTIRQLQAAGTLTLAQINRAEEDPGLLSRLVNLLGPQAVRLRFELLPGVSTPEHFRDVLLCASWHELSPRVTVDLRGTPDRTWLVQTFRRMVEMTMHWGLELAVAAPAHMPGLHQAVPGLYQPDDLTWALALRPHWAAQLQGCTPITLPN